MSKATKRKHVTKQVLDEYVLPSENQSIAKILGGRGNNLHEVEDSNGETFLVSMPTKFRKNVWIKRGDFVLTEPIAEGDKVKAEIVSILYSDQIKYIKSQGQWPERFSEEVQNQEDNSNNKEIENSDDGSSEDSQSSDNDDLFVNTNRPQVTYEESSNDSDSDANSSESEDN